MTPWMMLKGIVSILLEFKRDGYPSLVGHVARYDVIIFYIDVFDSTIS